MRPVLLASVLGLLACPPPKLVERPYPPPTAQELFDHLVKRRSALKSMRAETRVDHLGEGGERVKVTVGMLLQRGGKLRLEAEAPIGGGTLVTLVADGARFQLLDVKNNRFLEGPAKACNVARLIRLSMEPEDIIDALTGSAPLSGEPTSAAWEDGRERLELKLADGGVEKIWLDARNKSWDVVAAERRGASGQVLWKLSHSDFSDRGGGIRLPGRTDLQQPPRADARIKFRDIEINVSAPTGAFQLQPPSGIPVEPADC